MADTASYEFDSKTFTISRQVASLIDRYVHSIESNGSIRNWYASLLKVECVARLASLNPKAGLKDINALHTHLVFDHDDFKRLPEDILAKIHEEFTCRVTAPEPKIQNTRAR